MVSYTLTMKKNAKEKEKYGLIKKRVLINTTVEIILLSP